MSEDTIYADSTVSISTARLVINGTTYPLRNITSVKVGVTEVRSNGGKGCALGAVGCGGILVLTAGSAVLVTLAESGLTRDAGIGLVPLLVAGSILTVSIIWLRSAKPKVDTTFHVTIAASSGEAHALSSKDLSYVEKVVKHINDAIIKRE